MLEQLPINLENLIYQRTVEQTRLEYKKSWDKYTKNSVIKTICAFANDLYNLNGGYIIIGIEEDQGKPQLPPHGIDNFDSIQREILDCLRLISPQYIPRVYNESFQGKQLVIIWCPAGDNRPYQGPHDKEKRVYWVRTGSSTIEAKHELLTQLIEQTAKIPFDDRRNLKSTISDIKFDLVEQYLKDTRSYLFERFSAYQPEEIYQKLDILAPVNNHSVPKNVALMFFNYNPEKFFNDAFIEVVQFGDDAGGDLIEEKQFKGPLSQQIQSCLTFLEGMGGQLLQKIDNQAEVDRSVPYPYEAIEEAIVNAVYHRGYDEHEPIKIYLYPDRMEITSYPGPVKGINKHHFETGNHIPNVPARNRRVGELLKELRLAERRGTGIPKIIRRMDENGSPSPSFDFDDDHTYFTVILPVHSKYVVLHSIRESAHLWAIGEKNKALNNLLRTYDRNKDSGTIVSQIVEYSLTLDNDEIAQKTFSTFQQQPNKSNEIQPYLTYTKMLLDKKKINEASDILASIPQAVTYDEKFQTAILRKKSKDFEGAHLLLSEIITLNPNDPEIIHDFAQTKIQLAKQNKNDAVKKRLTREAVELLRKSIQLHGDPIQKSWSWFELAKALDWSKKNSSEVETAFLNAQSLNPSETKFKDVFNEWKKRKNASK